MVIRPTHENTARPGRAIPGVDPQRLSAADRAKLLDEIELNGARLVAEEKLGFGTTPSLTLGGVTPKPYAVRLFVASIAITVVLGTAMYIVEGVIAGNPGFSSVPQSVYWGIVTISTVGYGDITPVTVIGKFIATLIMLIGYGIIAVPTGIVTAELNLTLAEVRLDQRKCPECGHAGHDPKASFCKMCGYDI